MTRRPEPTYDAVLARQPSVNSRTRGLVLVLSLTFAIGGLFTLPPAPARALSSHWQGQTGSIVPGEGETASGTFVAAGSGADTAAQFTYDVPVSGGDGESGTWSFSTVADLGGTVAAPWRWTGLHAWFNVTARLDAVVVRGATLVSTTNLVNTGPEVCCTSPSNGFDYSGTASFTVEAGDRYGFVLRGSNGDLNDLLRGELTFGEVPESCSDAQNLYHPYVPGDGRLVINPAGGQRFSVYCADMANLFNGKDYLEVRTGPGLNYGQYATGGAATGPTVTTTYTKLRLDPATLTVDVNDTLFTSPDGGPLTHPDSIFGDSIVTEMPYATAMGCDATENATANINLQGTPFAVDDTFDIDDLGTGSATFSQLDQVVDITGGGFCGWTAPSPAPFNPFNPDALGPDFKLDLRYLNAPDVNLETPVLFNSIAQSGNTAALYARVEGAASIPVTVEVRTSASCTDGVLDGGSPVASATATTDADGYVAFSGVAAISSGEFVTITVTSPTGPVAAAPSACIRTTADNDSWPKALPLQFASPATVQDVIESDGRARWYRFSIFPNQRITINVAGLSSDYDLAVFRDIGAEFESQLVPQDADDLTRLSAEFAPSVFSPSVFSPSVFSPSVFSPDAYAPSVFSPSVFSPSVFSPSVFSPSVFSPSVFSPSVFSPSVFSPSVFSPSVFSPSVFSPSVFSPSVFSDVEIQQAFSSAQTRSLIGVSATPGTGDETVVVNSWNETGEFYVRVAGRGGAFDPSNLFTLTVTPSGSECTGLTETALGPRPANIDAGDFSTVIVTDSSRIDLSEVVDGQSLGAWIEDLRTRPEVDGVLVDVAADPRVQELRDQADAVGNRGCPFAQNLVAEEITSIIDSYRTRAASPTAAVEALRYVTILGDDTVVPFFRYPDQSLLGQESGYFPPVESDSISEASLRRDYVLSQDAYGAGVEVDIRMTAFPVPDLAVGRLVETEAEIVGMIDAYIDAGGVVSPDSALVTGYDFLTDAADAMVDELDPSVAALDELITNADVSPQQLQQPGMTDPRTWSWDADDLRSGLLGERHDLVYLAGHFSANSALAADYQTQVVTTELAASSVDLESSIVISAGCHAGYNLVNGDALTGVALDLDWAQAFAQKGATLVAGTGYQYGDTDFLEYSERLYRDFAIELRRGQVNTPISIGEALAAAKRTYIATTQDIRGIHEKAVLEATLFGLPMLGVDFATGRTGTPGGGGAGIVPSPVADGPASTLGLATHDLTVDPDLTGPQSRALDVIGAGGTVTGSVTATWLEGPDGVVTNPAEPALPKQVVDVSADSDDLVLRGVGFRGGTYADESNVLPLSGAPTTELRGVHAPFVSPVFYPMRTWTANYFGELSGSGGTNLIVTPVQHRSDTAVANRSIRRVFDDLDLRLYYLDTPAFLAAEGGDFAGSALADAPTIVDVHATPDGTDIVFSARVLGDPSAAIHEVWVVWTDGDGEWVPLDLEQCTGATLPASCAGLDDSRVWTGRLTGAPASIQYVAQATNGTGLVSFDDNRGQYYLGSTTPAPAAVATTMDITAAPASGTFGQTVNVTAQLRAGSVGVVGKPVLIQIGGAAAFGLTGPDGLVTLPISLNSTPAVTSITATFGGDTTHQSSADEQAFTIGKAGTSMSALLPFVTITDDDHRGILTTLTAALGSTSQPLQNRTVTATVAGPVTKTLSLITDYLGRVRMPLDLPAGSYSVAVSFAGDETYLPTSRSGTTAVVDVGFLSPVDNPPIVNVVKAGNTVPIKFSLGGNHGLGVLDGTPIAVPFDCDSGVPTDEVEQTSTANSGLTFTNGVYQYNWKTPKNARGCFSFQIPLDDGTVHIALFRLR